MGLGGDRCHGLGVARALAPQPSAHQTENVAQGGNRTSPKFCEILNEDDNSLMLEYNKNYSIDRNL